MIPLSIYRENVAKFNPKLNVSDMVRLRKHSTRRSRRGAQQDVGDTYNWKHQGLGSGNTYYGRVASDILQKEVPRHYGNITGVNPDVSSWQLSRSEFECNKLVAKKLEIGKRFSVNSLWAYDKTNWYRKREIRRYWHSQYSAAFSIRDFTKDKIITSDGMYGHKQLLNGYIKEVYIHFLYPTWNTKRESRFEVMWENGSSGIFTDDYLDRVYDVDYSVDDSLYQCSHSSTCDITNCDHKSVHYEDEECTQGCNYNSEATCRTICDLDNLIDMCSGKGKIDDGQIV